MSPAPGYPAAIQCSDAQPYAVARSVLRISAESVRWFFIVDLIDFAEKHFHIGSQTHHLLVKNKTPLNILNGVSYLTFKIAVRPEHVKKICILTSVYDTMKSATERPLEGGASGSRVKMWCGHTFGQ
jgi:hypothetical protein